MLYALIHLNRILQKTLQMRRRFFRLSVQCPSSPLPRHYKLNMQSMKKNIRNIFSVNVSISSVSETSTVYLQETFYFRLLKLGQTEKSVFPSMVDYISLCCCYSVHPLYLHFIETLSPNSLLNGQTLCVLFSTMLCAHILHFRIAITEQWPIF